VHEVGLVSELVDAVRARASGRRVALVRVRRASTLPEDALRLGWDLLADGPLADARLVDEPWDVRLACGCGWRGVLGHDELIGPGRAVCPGCGGLGQVPLQPELELLEVRFQDG
jgi:hypothetical protein